MIIGSEPVVTVRMMSRLWVGNHCLRAREEEGNSGNSVIVWDNRALKEMVGESHGSVINIF